MDFFQVFQEFYENESIISKAINSIVLIPKVKGAKRVKDYRRIVVAKYVQNYLEGIGKSIENGSPRCTWGESMCSIQDRHIHDGVLVANEYMEDYRCRKQKELVLKIGLEKAYDKMYCNFLDFAMARKGFSTRRRTG